MQDSESVPLSRLRVVLAEADDFPGFLALAAEVEDWFGTMLDDPGFHQALAKNIARGTAACVRAGDGPPGAPLLGGLLFSPRRSEPLADSTNQPADQLRLGWLVVSSRWRQRGVGRALVSFAINRMQSPLEVSVVTFGADHPAGEQARRFYQSLGFHPAEAVAHGPEGGSRQVFRLSLAGEASER